MSEAWVSASTAFTSGRSWSPIRSASWTRRRRSIALSRYLRTSSSPARYFSIDAWRSPNSRLRSREVICSPFTLAR